MTEKPLKDIVYVDIRHDVEWKMDYIPDYVFSIPTFKDETSYVAYASSYRFESCDGVSYFVLRLNVCEEFLFDKYYPLNDGLNDELFNMLKKIRAIRSCDSHIYFKALLHYNFYFNFEQQENGYYIIYNVRIDEDSYYYNFDTSKETVFADFCK